MYNRGSDYAVAGWHYRDRENRGSDFTPVAVGDNHGHPEHPTRRPIYRSNKHKPAYFGVFFCADKLCIGWC